MSRKKSAKSDAGEGELDNAISKMILSTAGTEEEEVTDAEAAAVLAEILNGKVNTEGAAEEDEGSRKILLKSTTKCLEQAGKVIRIAVTYDSNGDSTKALESYEKGIELFSQGLSDEALTEKNALHIIQSLESYLDRSIELQLSNKIHDFSRKGIYSRKLVFERMVKHHFNPLKRGVSLYSKAKKEGKKNGLDSDWNVSVLYSESLECLILAMKAGAGKTSPMVSNCVNEMMTRLEEVNENNPPENQES